MIISASLSKQYNYVHKTSYLTLPFHLTFAALQILIEPFKPFVPSINLFKLNSYELAMLVKCKEHGIKCFEEMVYFKGRQEIKRNIHPRQLVFHSKREKFVFYMPKGCSKTMKIEHRRKRNSLKYEINKLNEIKPEHLHIKSYPATKLTSLKYFKSITIKFKSKFDEIVWKPASTNRSGLWFPDTNGLRLDHFFMISLNDTLTSFQNGDIVQSTKNSRISKLFNAPWRRHYKSEIQILIEQEVNKRCEEVMELKPITR